MRACVILDVSGWRDPVGVLAAFADEPYAIGFLSGGDGPRARWSYLARAPVDIVWFDAAQPGDPFEAVKALQGEGTWAVQPDGPPFQGGVAGLCAYELAERLEPIGLSRRDAWPDLACGLYAAVLAFDHRAQRVLAIGRGGDAAQARSRAEAAASWLDTPATRGVLGAMAPDFRVQTSRQAYEAAVADVIARIAAGEIFQANIARLWTGRLSMGARPIDLMSRLVAASPAPFAAYLRLEDRAVVSNSPERFLQVRPDRGGLVVESRPIKGTRPRGGDPVEDRRLAAELLASDKDRAENLMIVDLMRNDLSRVGTRVRTTELCRLESFANVHHLVSTVEARLADGLVGLDALAAAFPPGSVTGAPKIQAMKVIAGLEPPRGPYCGSMFWAGFDGTLDSSVLIRTAVLVETATGWRIEARAGAGIVADSDPAAEASEAEDKMSAIAAALGATSP